MSRQSRAPSGKSCVTDPADYVQSLARGLSIIEAMGQEARAVTLSEVAARVDLSRAVVRRFLLTLQGLGYVGSEDGKHFALQPRVLALGYAYLSSSSLSTVLEGPMRQLVESVKESCSASVLDGHEIVYVARVPTERIMSVNLSVGTRLPAYCTSMGRVLLADLPAPELRAFLSSAHLERRTPRTVTDPKELLARIEEARERGYCLVDQELEEGVRSVAVPLRDRSGRASAALNVATHVTRITRERVVKEVLPALRAAADRVSSLLSGRPPTPGPTRNPVV